MSEKATKCPKCGSEMRQGFIFDFTKNQRLVSQWAPGAPKRSFLVGTKLPEESLIPVAAFRCEGCGFLEQYARAEFAAK